MAIDASRVQTSWRPGEELPLRIENVPMPAIARGKVGQQVKSKLMRGYGVKSLQEILGAFYLLPVASTLKDLLQFSHLALHHTTSHYIITSEMQLCKNAELNVSSLLPCQEGSGASFSSPCPQEAFKSFTCSNMKFYILQFLFLHRCFIASCLSREIGDYVWLYSKGHLNPENSGISTWHPAIVLAAT